MATASTAPMKAPTVAPPPPKPQKFATVDGDGKVTGFYSSDVHKTLPAGAVPITDDQWRVLMADQHGTRLINGVVTPAAAAAPVPLTPQQQIAQLEASCTPQRLRAAILGNDGGWLKKLDAQITALKP
jgi:hypothetical protein